MTHQKPEDKPRTVKISPPKLKEEGCPSSTISTGESDAITPCRADSDSDLAAIQVENTPTDV